MPARPFAALHWATQEPAVVFVSLLAGVMHSATIPETCGAAMDVPDMRAVTFPGHVLKMHTPGAATVWFSAFVPMVMKLENDAYWSSTTAVAPQENCRICDDWAADPGPTPSLSAGSKVTMCSVHQSWAVSHEP